MAHLHLLCSGQSREAFVGYVNSSLTHTQAWIGCIVSTISSCKDYGLFLRTGQCSSPAELKIQVISLYYAYAVDVLTDFMGMSAIHISQKAG